MTTKSNFILLILLSFVFLKACATREDYSKMSDEKLARIYCASTLNQHFYAEFDEREIEVKTCWVMYDKDIQWKRKNETEWKKAISDDRRKNLENINQCKKLIEEIELGTLKSEISWPKHTNENFRMPEKFMLSDSKMEIQYCKTSLISDGQNTDDEFTPFIFVNNKLAGIGWRLLGGKQTYGDKNAQSNQQLDNAARAIAICRLLNLPNC